MKALKTLILVLTIVSCSSIKVNYDYENKHDFSKYKTYNYYSDMETRLSVLDTRRLLDVLDEALKLKGLNRSDNPDFFIDISSIEYEIDHQSTVGLGVGGTGDNVGGGISVGIPVGGQSINRQIIFDFVDEQGIGLFWQAIAEHKFNPRAKPEQREAQFKALVKQVVSGFPPKK